MNRCLRVGCFALLMAVSGAGCVAFAQSAATDEAAFERRIEILVRRQFHVPSQYQVVFGARHASRFSGFDELPLTLTSEGKSTEVTFLISADNKTLARLESFDIAAETQPEIDLAGRPVRGDAAAPVTVVVFDDLECPVCARMHAELFPATQAHYAGKVRFVYKDNPLVELHPWAFHAAVDGGCLAQASGDAYWAYVDYVHTHVEDVSGRDRNVKNSFAALDNIARGKAIDAGLDMTALNACLERQDETAVRGSTREAESLGLHFAPAIYVNGERVDGYVPEAVLWQVIDRALRAAGVEPPAAAVAARP